MVVTTPAPVWMLSIRARLTIWYTTALAVLLVVVALATYGMIARTTRSDADAYLTETADAVAASLQFAIAEVPTGGTTSDSTAIKWAAERTLQNHRFRDIGVAIFRARDKNASGPDLRLLAVDSTSSATRYFGGAAGWRRASTSAVRALGRMKTDVTTLEPLRERVVSLPVRTRRGTFVVALSQSMEAHDNLLGRVREALLIGIPLALLLATLGGFLLSAASLRPVEAMRLQAERIGERTLHERLPVSAPQDELARLSRTFNALLDRVEDAFDQRRRFTADASHELRTPVAIVIGECELAIANERTPAEYRAALTVIHGEARRLALIVNDLFLLARSDAAEQPLVRISLFLEELVGDCVDAMESIARARRVSLRFTPASEVPCTVDDALVRRLVTNLLDNAIKYTPSGGTVHVDVAPLERGRAVIRVTDTGAGIATEHQQRIFERFYRVQHTTHRTGPGDTTGAGLGLPIAAWIATAHGGTLQLVRSDTTGSSFEATLG